jgi:hypothetical protein
MKKLLAAIAVMSLCSTAFAAPEAAAPAVKTAQQSKMVTCNVDAADKKGDERKAFMKTCLSAKPVKAMTPQQEKMKACNVTAAGKKGDERKAFMKTCLSAPKA